MMKFFSPNNFLCILLLAFFMVVQGSCKDHATAKTNASTDSIWIAPSLFVEREPTGEERAMLIYGQEVIANTARYFGPEGIISKNANGMNCQNCHLDAGTRSWGNSFGAVASTYPKFRARSGSIEGIYKRINDCFERSLNGKSVDTNTREMKAMHAYLLWLGKDVAKGVTPPNSGMQKIALPGRAADPQNGKEIYTAVCQRCHGVNGEGQKIVAGKGYTYPPLWGDHSYNAGAGMYRISNLAAFVYNNMPFNEASHRSPVLTLQQAWDVAAFVNSQPRPSMDISFDYKDIKSKPFDYPFGPYADSFSEQQHKYGPYQPIIDAAKK